MTAQITIIGTGRMGASVGLALASQKDQLFRVGHDRQHAVAAQAEKLGATDKTINNLFQAVENADIVLLAIPVDEVYEVLKLIANDLKQDAVVMDTSPCLVAACQWAKELLPEGRHFITLAPSQNPQYLLEMESGPQAAHADLFKNSLITICTPAGSDAGVIKLATDLTTLLGASPYFADALEYDGLTAASNTLPRLAAAALVNATMNQPGWVEGRKLAGRAYTVATEPLLHLDDEKKLGRSAILNKDNVVRVIDNYIQNLTAIRQAVLNEDQETLQKLVGGAVKGRESWLSERYRGNWDKPATNTELPSAGETIGRLFLGGLMRRRDKPEEKK
jgi:prephenate dehydrogenase